MEDCDGKEDFVCAICESSPRLDGTCKCYTPKPGECGSPEYEAESDVYEYTVLYRIEDMSIHEQPFGFACQAENIDHAKEQCEDAYPKCDIVWVWQGREVILP